MDSKQAVLRVKDIAESKVHDNDFLGARKFLLEAQKLYPSIENIIQMITVCDVHSAAQAKVNGETDWYAILQVESIADESSIKRQYRKLAFLLHPDKNKFVGAEAAFKLVGDANMILSDKGKRSLHDKLRASCYTRVHLRHSSKQSSRSSFASNKTQNSNGIAKKSSHLFHGLNNIHMQPPVPSNLQTFWTMCPHCMTKHQYYQIMMHRELSCEFCLKTFTASDIDAQNIAPGVKSSYPWNYAIPLQAYPGSDSYISGQMRFCDGSSSLLSQGHAGNGVFEKQSHLDFKSTVEVKKNEDIDSMKDSGISNHFWSCNSVNFVAKVSNENLNEREGKMVRPKRSRGKNAGGKDVLIPKSGNHAGQNVGNSDNHSQKSTRGNDAISISCKRGETYGLFTPKPKRHAAVSSGEVACSEEVSSRRIGLGTHEHFGSLGNQIHRNLGGIPVEEPLCCGNELEIQNKMHESDHILGDEKECFETATILLNHKFDLRPDAIPDPDYFTYLHNEVCFFAKQRDDDRFLANQIWAVYDNFDGMPRSYVQIREVFHSAFKVHFTWLEFAPRNKYEFSWRENKPPISCGNFKLGKPDLTEDKLMFSTCMSWSKGAKENSYDIYPKRGEVWALFKQLDVICNPHPEQHELCEYEIVEVLSDYSDTVDICVFPLVRIEGFENLFMPSVQQGVVSHRISCNEFPRFSHLIPSYRMIGRETEGIPVGSFKLDFASLPCNVQTICTNDEFENGVNGENLGNVSSYSCPQPKCDGFNDKFENGVKVENLGTVSSDSCPQPKCDGSNKIPASKENHAPENCQGLDVEELPCSVIEVHSAEHDGEYHYSAIEEIIKRELGTTDTEVVEKSNGAECQCPTTQNASEVIVFPMLSETTVTLDYPASEFYNFEKERSIEKFQCGQIWALYSDINMFPNYYGCVKGVSLEESKVYIRWLDPVTENDIEDCWLDKHLPFACGIFQPVNEFAVYDKTNIFSHMIVGATREKDQYEIYPRNGEIWAVFKDWNSEWTTSSLKNCEYDVVEVISFNDCSIEVQLLVKVNGYRAVFKRKRGGIVMKTPPINLLIFSHRIPAFRLTEKNGGNIHGYWELDTASIPDNYLVIN